MQSQNGLGAVTATPSIASRNLTTSCQDSSKNKNKRTENMSELKTVVCLMLLLLLFFPMVSKKKNNKTGRLQWRQRAQWRWHHVWHRWEGHPRWHGRHPRTHKGWHMGPRPQIQEVIRLENATKNNRSTFMKMICANRISHTSYFKKWGVLWYFFVVSCCLQFLSDFFRIFE